ncbi:MAG: DUF2127 domain-containing protein [Candidatus Kaiserbacteria bacterium]|nr:DUF2127 domain-containing protein [Candidatus Kaiserbacteria bacterium]
MPDQPIETPAVAKREHAIYDVFVGAVVVKGLNAILEIVLGTLLLFTDFVEDVVSILVQKELIEDPNSFVATYIQSLLSTTPQVQSFGALYLLSHGIVKVFLMIGLLRNKLWAYPSTIVVLALFITYQMVRFLNTHSILLIFLSIFDALVVWLVWHEYKRLKQKAINQHSVEILI